ncbi:MAG: hypothetical protein WD598_00255, partial [Acidimicrobiia bacterium]
MRIRPVSPSDHRALTALFDAFQDGLAAMDPLGRETRVPGYGEHAVAATAEATRDRGTFLVAQEDDGSLRGFVAGTVERTTPEQGLTTPPSQEGASLGGQFVTLRCEGVFAVEEPPLERS